MSAEIVAAGLWPVEHWPKHDRPQVSGYNKSRTQLTARR
jgi:hypothetical protein